MPRPIPRHLVAPHGDYGHPRYRRPRRSDGRDVAATLLLIVVAAFIALLVA